MKSNRLHQLWELIEAVPTDRLLRLNQKALADLLIQKLNVYHHLVIEEEAEVRAYVDSRFPLIRESAQLRQGVYGLFPAYA